MTRLLDYCGCCGRRCPSCEEWCDDCKLHLLPSGPPWERTYFAQHGKPCPLSVLYLDREIKKRKQKR